MSEYRRIMTTLMTKTEIKEQAQWQLLNNGDGAFLYLQEDTIERLEQKQKPGSYGYPPTPEDIIELENAKSIYAEMETQFERMKKFFLFEAFQGSH